MSGITELLAASRRAAKRADYYTTGEGKLFNALADAFELPAVPSGDVVINPTIGGNDRNGGQSEDEREVLAAVVDSVDIIREKGETRDYPTRIADAILARFRLPVPVEPEWEQS